MDVVAVVPSLRSGGAERVLLALAGLLHDLGHGVRVVVIDPDGPLRPPDGVAVTSLDRRRVRRALPRLLRLLRRERPHVVLSSETHLNVALCLARPLLPRGTRLIVRESQMLPAAAVGRGPGRLRSLRDRAYPAADLVLATSEPMAAELRRSGTERVAVLPNPVDVPALRADAGTGPDGGTTERGDGRRFVAVGRLVPVKALDDLIGAFRAIAAPADRLDVVGDGPEHARLGELAGGDGRIVFHGHLGSPAHLVALADVLVLPSRSEGMPNAVLEALALGTPVIATTDLATLIPLAAETGPEVLRLVPRGDLAARLDTVPADISPRPRPSLLPPRFDRMRVGRALERLLGGTDADTGTSAAP